MQLYIDSANPNEVKQINDLGIIDGVTTNPTLAAKAGVTYQEAVSQILKTVEDNISLEVLATDARGMIEEGQKLTKLSQKAASEKPR